MYSVDDWSFYRVLDATQIAHVRIASTGGKYFNRPVL